METTVLTFGKYKNQTIEDVYAKDKSYIFWLSENAFKDALKNTVKNFLKHKKEEDKLILKNDKYVFNFGKFYGKTLLEAYKEKPRYMNWMLREFKDDTLIQTVITDFLNHMKVVKKRLKSLQEAKSNRIYNEKLSFAKDLANKIDSLKKDNFYVFDNNNSMSGRGSDIFKINNVILNDTCVNIDVTTYEYNVIKNEFTVKRSSTWNNIESLPQEFNSNEYNIIFIIKNGMKVVSIDGNVIKTESNTKTVRIMSDVYADVTYHTYNGMLLFTTGEGSVYEKIYSNEKTIIKVVKDEDELKIAKRSCKISKLMK